MIFYCKPYAKATNENYNYVRTISKPSFVIMDKEKEVFLNGELLVHKKTMGHAEQGRIMKRTAICLKGLSVETELNSEATRNTYTIVQAKEKLAAATANKQQTDWYLLKWIIWLKVEIKVYLKKI